MISVENLIYHADDFSIQADLKILGGQFCAVLGPSGAGKSTLLSLIAGFEKPQSGKIYLDGKNAERLTPSQRPVSMVFQDHNVFHHLTVWKNVALGISPRLKLSYSQRSDVDAALVDVGLTAMADRLPSQISGGEAQRIALARVLVRRRKILLLDEPFGALDPGLRLQMLNEVKRLAAAQHLTVMMVTHQPDDAMRIADHVIFVSNGQVAKPVTTETFFQSPVSAEIATYLGR